jgi:hypothetical protein
MRIETLAIADETLNGKRRETLVSACERGDVGAVRRLLLQGVDINMPDDDGRSPLIMACLADQPVLVDLLLALFAAVNQSTACCVTCSSGFYHVSLPIGATPLYAAARVGAFRCAELLLEAHANPNLRTADKITPMLVSCHDGHLDIAMLLSSYGANRDSTTSFCMVDQSLAEQIARMRGHSELLSALKETSRYSPIQHVKMLSKRRATALLRSGACSPIVGAPTAVQIARECTESPASETILRAAAPWSPLTHELWGSRHRALAVQLCQIGYQLAYSPRIDNTAFADSWIWHVMPMVLSWERLHAIEEEEETSGACGGEEDHGIMLFDEAIFMLELEAE